jgi:hypothetical protein
MFLAALISVGLAAPADTSSASTSPRCFSTSTPPPTGVRPSTLGLDVDIRIWTLHLHYAGRRCR